MMVFSGYLMYLLVTVIKALCIYCLASAIMSTSLFVLSLLGRDWEDSGQLFFLGIIVAMITAVGSLGLYAQANGSPSVADGDPRLGPPITTVSTPGTIDLAKYLKSSGAVMYGAYWCPHCHEQKELFGKEANAELAYVECDAGGINPQPDLCRSKGIQGYPSWEIKGELYSGRQTLDELAEYSGYPGPRNF